MPSQEKTFFGLRHRKHGDLIRLNPSAGHCDCNGYMQLTRDEGFPHLAFDSEQKLASLLMKDTPSYNAHDETSASWGEFNREDLVPVKVRITQEIEDLELREPLQVKTIEVRRIPRRSAKSYAGEELPHPGDAYACFWLAHLPEGLGIADVNQHIGELVHPLGDRYMGRELLRAIPVPGEYAPLISSGPGVLLLTRDWSATS